MAVKALEDDGVRFTFGIPGTHNIELYDALEDSKSIEPILVTDEQSASFMADAVSRTTDSIGVVNTVPGAGVTHALSGIAEAYMDNTPLLVLTCGIRTDSGRAYQLHDIDQLAILKPVCKDVFHVAEASEIYPTIRWALALARSGAPGPVAVEIPVNLYLQTQDVPEPAGEYPVLALPSLDPEDIEKAARLLIGAKRPAIYVGNGARAAVEPLQKLAEQLCAPVVTTIQGKGVFNEKHRLWLWNGFGNSAPSFVRRLMDSCDCLLAIGCRFGEVATASYGMQDPRMMIHVDIDEEVLDKNFKAELPIVSDARVFIDSLLERMDPVLERPELVGLIKRGHEKLQSESKGKRHGSRVSPRPFFDALQNYSGEEAIYTTDSGNGTFLAMEMLRLEQPGCFIGPVDYSCMGYAVPAAIAAKLANPQRDVIALAGDGALLMTGLELLTAASYPIAPVVFVLRDGELCQISQLQSTSLVRDTCTVLPDYSTEDFARTVNCGYLSIKNDDEIGQVVSSAFERSRAGEPMLVEVAIDYSQKTYFTKGVITTNFWRMKWGERLRMISRAVKRRVSKSILK